MILAATTSWFILIGTFTFMIWGPCARWPWWAIHALFSISVLASACASLFTMGAALGLG